MARRKGYSRVLVKISGEALGGAGRSAIEPDSLRFVAGELAGGYKLCKQMGVVMGAGNIARGEWLSGLGLDRVRCDQAGMTGTVVNCIVLAAMLEKHGVPATVFSSFPAGRFVEGFEIGSVRAAISEHKVALFAGGTGNPYFTTDTAAALRAVEVGAEVLLKATKVDGVYSDDPVRNPQATRFEKLGYMEAIERRLGVMDLTAISLCMENGLPIRVFNFFRPGGLAGVLAGNKDGTIVS